MRVLIASVAVVAAAGMVGGTWLYTQRATDAFAQCRGGQVAGHIGGPFTLVDQTGATVTDKDVLTGPALVYFGYTFCPDVCPLDNARNAEVADILEERGVEVTPVFISIDPERDTPEVMADYAANFHPRMIALTGTDAQVKAASMAYRTFYQKQPSDDGYYLMDHTTFTYLMMPQSGFADFFPREMTADQVADKVSCFVDAS